MKPIGHARDPAGAAEQLVGDLVHAQRVLGRELEPPQQLELRPGEVRARLEPLIERGLDDSVGLLEVHPGGHPVTVGGADLRAHVFSTVRSIS
jgi:hypothetical protein